MAMPFSHGRRTTIAGKSASEVSGKLGQVRAVGIAVERASR